MTGRFLLACIAALAGAAASAQDYPAKPVRLVVGFAAGGPTDVIARVIAQDMAMSLGQGVVVENKTGANALIATQEVKRATPDGYTILMTTLSHNVNAILLADQKPYDPIRDLPPSAWSRSLRWSWSPGPVRRSTRSRTSCRPRRQSRAEGRTPRPGTAGRRPSPPP